MQNRTTTKLLCITAVISLIGLINSACAQMNNKKVNKVPATTWGITPDRRAIESGIFIMPRDEAKEAEVSFTVTEPTGIARKNHPVRGGIPLFRGELKDTSKIVLIDDQGSQVPVQGMATAFWPEGTAKFICIDFLTDLTPKQTRKYTLKFGTEIPAYGKDAMKVVEKNNRITVNTGIMEVSFLPGQEFSSKILINGKEVTRNPLKGFLTISEGKPDSKPADYPLIIDSVRVEEHGPVQATVYLKGSFGTKKAHSPLKWQQKYPRFPFHGFVRIYTGTARMDVTYTLGFNGNEHKEFIRRYGLTVPLSVRDGTFEFGKSKTESAKLAVSADVLLAQPHHSNWKLMVGDKEEMTGKRFGGWASLSKGGSSVLIGLRNAWQQWPVSFRATPQGDLSIDIHGGDDDNFLDLRYTETEKGPEWVRPDPKKKYHLVGKHRKSKSMYTGEKLTQHYQSDPKHRAAGLLKISELVIDFTPTVNASNVGSAHHRMLVPWPGKKRYTDTRVFGLTGYFPDLEKNPSFRKMFNFHARNNVDLGLVQHEANGLYGWVDYPDSMDVQPPKKGGTGFNADRFQGGEGWTNGEKANQAVVALYVSSGWRRTLDYGHQMLLHTLGFDAEHSGGDMATGVTHRHCQVHWASAGSPRQAGCHIGWYWYYWISGHNEMGRALKELWRNPLGISHKRGAMAEWPFHPDNNTDKDFIIPEGTKTAHAFAAKGSIYHWVSFNRWQTTGDKRFVAYFESLYNGLKQNPYKEKKGKKTYHPRLKVSLVDDKQFAQNSDLENLGNPRTPQRPNFYDYYFRAYYGKTLIAEWAQLTGSKHAIDLLLMMGDYDWGEPAHANFRKMAPESITKDTKTGKKDHIQWLYYSHGQILPAYYLLRSKDKNYQGHIQRMLKLVQARTTWPQNRMGEVIKK